MSTTEAVKSSKEYMNVPIVELIESSTNPRKVFDKSFLEELAESIRNRGILSPLLVRPVNNHLEIVAGAQRYRAAKLAGLEVAPIRLKAMTDLEAQEAQQIENVQRKDVHPFEEAQGYRTLLGFEGANYTIEKLAARIGKRPQDVAERLKLLDLTEPVANAFVAGHIGLGHALLIAKLAADTQEKALAHCFDGYCPTNDPDRSLVPVRRLQAWMAQNIYLSLKSVPFSKDDETLVRDAGSCANCQKRTGFNRLLFSEVAEDSDACTDAACFNRKLNEHVAQRVAKIPNLVQISESYRTLDGACVRPRNTYVEVVARTKGKDTLPEHKPCNHLTTAIHTDGVQKGRLVKVCANPDCKIHFGNRKKEEEQRIQWKAEKLATNRKAKETMNLRHLILAEVLKRVKHPLDTEPLRLVAQFVVASLPHDLACRLAKRHGFEPSKKGEEWKLAEKANSLYKTANGSALAALVFEAILLGSAGRTSEPDNDPLIAAAKLYNVDVKTLRRKAEKAEKEKTTKLQTAKARKNKQEPKAKAGRK